LLDPWRVTAWRLDAFWFVRSAYVDGLDGSIWGDPWGELSCNLIGCKG
jgi:hypothetical protein